MPLHCSAHLDRAGQYLQPIYIMRLPTVIKLRRQRKRFLEGRKKNLLLHFQVPDLHDRIDFIG